MIIWKRVSIHTSILTLICITQYTPCSPSNLSPNKLKTQIKHFQYWCIPHKRHRMRKKLQRNFPDRRRTNLSRFPRPKRRTKSQFTAFDVRPAAPKPARIPPLLRLYRPEFRHFTARPWCGKVFTLYNICCSG